MQIKLSGATSDELQVDDAVFDRKYNEPLIHQVVTTYIANSHNGSRAQKTRSQVRGGGAKPWRQKGTGRARAGTIRSPLWRGGGVIFAANPKQTSSKKVNKKMFNAAMCSILSELLRQKRLVVVAGLEPQQPKTKLLLAQMNELNLRDVLIIVDKVERNLELAARNLAKIVPLSVSNVDPVSLLKHENILITVDAVKKIEGRLG